MSDVTRDSEARSPIPGLPIIGIPVLPHALTIWARVLTILLAGVVFYLVDQLTYVLLDFWLMESTGYESVFWTNFRMGFVLFLIGVGGVGSGIIVPALTHPIGAAWRRVIVLIGINVGLIAGLLMAYRFQEFLLLFNGVPFGESDPHFNRDIAFYAFSLPAIWVIVAAVGLATMAGLASSVLCACLIQPPGTIAKSSNRIVTFVKVAATPMTLVNVAILGLAGAAWAWLSRYNVLIKNNEDSLIFGGAEYIDVVGLFSTVNYYYVTTLVVLIGTGGILYKLFRIRQEEASPALERAGWRPLLAPGALLVGLLAFDLGFRALVAVRDVVAVISNEPAIQLDFIKRHIDATRKAYQLESVETVTFRPNDISDPIPNVDELLNHITLRNAPLWPGYVTYIERVVDPQHSDRILLTLGDDMVYGPVLEVFRQQQKLRTYYDFLDIDTVRYKVDGETRMYVSGVRELPMDVEPWLYRWGQHGLLFTHGQGLVMVPASGLSEAGEPVYASSGIPTRATSPELEVHNQAVYYGEGGGRFGTGQRMMAFSNAAISELDYPTDDGRAEVTGLPSDADWGVLVDSLLKRLVMGWRSDALFEVLFTELLSADTRAHYYRTPIERAERFARFLFIDSNPWAVIDNGGITWMLNGMTTADGYPNSNHQWLGDKSDERSFYVRPRPELWMNYVRDSVKVTIDAYTGKVRFYKFADEPVVNTWANVYPDLFTSPEEMPEPVRAQLQYPFQMFHIQFDNVFKRYHMTDPLEFFNVEDLWDDADEVKGPVLDEGEAITFSIEPYYWIAETGDVLPGSNPSHQFVLSAIFANEKANNLRAIPTVYMDGPDYGRLVNLQIPKGYFYPGPEQADAEIDQDTNISQSINWWNRLGAEVIRGHTSTVVIGREIIFIEPLLIRSKQNNYPQIKRVVVVFRGHANDGATLEEALRGAIEKARIDQKKMSPGYRQATTEEESDPAVVPD